jgi:hypothetical protein
MKIFLSRSLPLPYHGIVRLFLRQNAPHAFDDPLVSL